MRASIVVGLSIVCFSLSGCSRLPTLYEATGSTKPPEIFIHEVINRVKCEVYDAAQSVGEYRNLEWASDWTAKAVLTLTIVNNDGLTPNVAFVDPLKNGQKFTFGVSATLSESATRTETITFTLPFGSLINSNQALVRHLHDCDETARGIRGGLGLREWVRSAFSPLPNGELLSNARKQSTPNNKLVSELQTLICFELKRPDCKYSGSQKAALYWAGVKALSDPCVDRAFELLNNKSITPDIQAEITKHKNKLTQCKTSDLLYASTGGPAAFDKLRGEFEKTYLEASAYYDANIAPYESVLKDNAPVKTKELLDKIHSVLNDRDLLPLILGKDGNPSFSPGTDNGDNKYSEYCDIISDDGCKGIYINPIRESVISIFVNSLHSYGNALASYIKSFKPSKPVDSMTHTVIFLVTYSASLSPNWTLIGLTTSNNPMANAQGQRTHSLLITIGPDSENTANLATQQVVNVLSQPK